MDTQTQTNPRHESKAITYEYSQETLMEMIYGFEEWKDLAGHRQFLHYALFSRGIRPNAHILDASCGIGGDAIYLAGQGFNVSINDKDPEILEIARKNVINQGIKFGREPYKKESGVIFNTTHFDWNILRETYLPFSGVLCVGNSLTYLFSREEQLAALENLRDVTKKDGILIIDERNYQAMHDNPEAVRNREFQYAGIYRLSQGKVHLTPTNIKDNEIVMCARSAKLGHFMQFGFYPFKKGELKGLLKEVGFSKIEQYSDYQQGYNPRADFYQYVAVK